MLRICIGLFLSSLLASLPLMAQGQSGLFPPKKYPQNYFTWPVGAVQAIVANFGELRPNHYHMGLDCRTEQKENMPILAAADGFVAKVKIEPFGFGRALYVNHPNGMTTLYAHLNDFYPELEAYIKQEQYRLESWQVFLDLPPNRFQVKKGQFIAYSGNTGGSQGPHLHFEIRDTKTDKVLNPLLMYNNIPDNIPPDILRLAIYDRTKSVFEQSPRIVPLRKVNGVYQPASPIPPLPFSRVSFAVTAYDRYTGSTNQNGIYEGVLWENDTPIVGFQLDSISYDETRYLNAHIDFRMKTGGGSYVQHLSRLPGYVPGVYQEFQGDGVIALDDTVARNMRIVIGDPNGNRSTLQFAIRRSDWVPIARDAGQEKRSGLFHPGMVNVLDNDQVRLMLDTYQLYDSVQVRYSRFTDVQGRITHQILGGHVPVHTYFDVQLKYTGVGDRSKLVIRRTWNGKDYFEKAIPLGGPDRDWYKARFKALGHFQIYPDVDPPTIQPIGFRDGMDAGKLRRILFRIDDASDDIYNFRAELDGKWLRFTNDKGRSFVYVFDELCGPGEHELKISAEDVVGNRVERVYRFTR